MLSFVASMARTLAVHRLIHHRRHHHGLRRVGARSTLAIFERIAGITRGGEFTRLSTATIRAVAQGVIGVAFIQAIIVGLACWSPVFHGPAY